MADSAAPGRGGWPLANGHPVFSRDAISPQASAEASGRKGAEEQGGRVMARGGASPHPAAGAVCHHCPATQAPTWWPRCGSESSWGSEEEKHGRPHLGLNCRCSRFCSTTEDVKHLQLEPVFFLLPFSQLWPLNPFPVEGGTCQGRPAHTLREFNSTGGVSRLNSTCGGLLTRTKAEN